jgi:HEAT repeat protein
MPETSWIIKLDTIHTSYLILAILALTGLCVAALFKLGTAAWAIRSLNKVLDTGIRYGYELWERTVAWASWPVYLATIISLLVVGILLGRFIPGLRVFTSLITLFMGVTTCFAYMYLSRERAEVERGYKALNNPLKGQLLADSLMRHGHLVRVPLLVAASGATIFGFALLNQGLYETIGASWYTIAIEQGEPIYSDFLVYAIVTLLGIIDVLDMAKSQHLVGALNVTARALPATLLLDGFRIFFTVVLLKQLFSSIQQQKQLGETVVDFWSPHQSIHERARNALPLYGSMAISPLMNALSQEPALTRELRDQLPLILAAIGPSVAPYLIHHLSAPEEHVRAIAAASLGRLHVRSSLRDLQPLASDSSELVRASTIEAIGNIASEDNQRLLPPETLGRRFHALKLWLLRPSDHQENLSVAPLEIALDTLANGLADSSAAVRMQAARGIGKIGNRADKLAVLLCPLLQDVDETVRAASALSLGKIAGEDPKTVDALILILQDPSPAVQATAIRTLGSLKDRATRATPALVPLLQNHDDNIRNLTAEALSGIGSLDETAVEALVKGLDHEDNVVRARTAEALGTIGAAAAEAAPALVEAMSDNNDRVRATAIEALGKMGEVAAETALPSLLQALDDQDNWVSALAAEALGQMGQSDDETIRALIESLSHVNTQVRINSAESLGKLGASASLARTALEAACKDTDAQVRSQALRALGSIGSPTPETLELALTALEDLDPLVRVAVTEAMSIWSLTDVDTLAGLTKLFDDPSEQVKVELSKSLPKLAGATPEVLAGLSRFLVESNNAWLQVHAALALGRLGPAAAIAGPSLLLAAQTGEVIVREQSMRAIVLIHPTETTQALIAGLKDPSEILRKVASAGWMKLDVSEISTEAIAALVEALNDPEVQVRANAAHALARLETLPNEAIPGIVKATADPYDGLRLNAVVALKNTSSKSITQVMSDLLNDTNSKISLIAASYLLAADPDNAEAQIALNKALEDQDPRVRKAAAEAQREVANRTKPATSIDNQQPPL